jgi:fructosamine-3-kinase
LTRFDLYQAKVLLDRREGRQRARQEKAENGAVDLEYLRAHPQHLPTFLTHQRIRETPVSGGSICVAQRLTLDDGASVFTKSLAGAPEGFFAAEAAGLRWLREAGAVPVPEIIAELPELLALEWIDEGEPTVEGAERLGRDLAELHRAGAEAFGAVGDLAVAAFIGSLPMDNTPSPGPWPAWFAERRLLPYLRISADRGALTATDVEQVERIIGRIDGYGGAEPPARLHGDLWPGNVVWDRRHRGWLVDPAAHGGHRETDLALLGLWGGVAHFERLRDAYDEKWPLGEGWRDRVPLHQLFLLLVHTALFGGGYRVPVMAAVRALT